MSRYARLYVMFCDQLPCDCIRDENFQRIREISRILSHQDRSCESSRSVEISFDQYRGVWVFIPHDKFIRIGLFRSVNRPFVVSESRAT